MWVYISTVTRCARLAADVGCPEPAAVVISSDNLMRSIAVACTEATKAIFYPSLLTRVRYNRSGYLLERTTRPLARSSLYVCISGSGRTGQEFSVGHPIEDSIGHRIN